MPEGKIRRSLKHTLEVPSPITVGVLAEFVAELPDDAEVTITTQMGGDQRDPYPIGYIFAATVER